MPPSRRDQSTPPKPFPLSNVSYLSYAPSMSVCATGHEPELISDDPRREIKPEFSDMSFAEAYDLAHEKYGVLVPRSAIKICLDLSQQAASSLLRRGAFTRVDIHGEVFVPLSELEARISQKSTGQLPRGGRGNRISSD